LLVLVAEQVGPILPLKGTRTVRALKEAPVVGGITEVLALLVVPVFWGKEIMVE
jgi:hypothetical protein